MESHEKSWNLKYQKEYEPCIGYSSVLFHQKLCDVCVIDRYSVDFALIALEVDVTVTPSSQTTINKYLFQ